MKQEHDMLSAKAKPSAPPCLSHRMQAWVGEGETFRARARKSITDLVQRGGAEGGKYDVVEWKAFEGIHISFDFTTPCFKTPTKRTIVFEEIAVR